MIEDDLLREVRAAREAYARLHNFDVGAKVADLRARNLAGDWPVVRHPPRRPQPVAAARGCAEPAVAAVRGQSSSSPLTERVPMPAPQSDTRSDRRKALDEQLAAEPLLPVPDAAPGDQPRPLEAHLRSRRRPVAVIGVVENGGIRLLDAKVKFPEQSRVIVVASGPG